MWSFLQSVSTGTPSESASGLYCMLHAGPWPSSPPTPSKVQLGAPSACLPQASLAVFLLSGGITYHVENDRLNAKYPPGICEGGHANNGPT